MRENHAGPPARLRLLKAIAIVLAVFLVIPGVDAVMRYADAASAPKATAVGIDASAVVRSRDAYAALERMETMADAHGASIPDAFSEEVGFLPGARDVRATEDGAVIGYLADGTIDDILADLDAHMQSGGWTAVPMGGVDGTTFVKSHGKCTWALITCTQVGESVSVVVRSLCT